VKVGSKEYNLWRDGGNEASDSRNNSNRGCLWLCGSLWNLSLSDFLF